MDSFTGTATATPGLMAKSVFWTCENGVSEDLNPQIPRYPQFSNQYQSIWPSATNNGHQDFHVPHSQAPQFQVMQSQAPQFQVPQSQAPQFQVPHTQAPQFQVAQSSGNLQQVHHKTPAFPANQQYPNWTHQVHSNYTQNVSAPAAPAWSPVVRYETWKDPMISCGTMIQNLPNAQVTPMTQGNVKAVSPALLKRQTLNRPMGVEKKKRKRKRTAFTTDQILTLEKVFSTQPYIDRVERHSIADSLKINERAIKIWFQNRRMKSKRDSLEDSDDEEDDTQGKTFIEQNSPPSDLDIIATKLQSTDQFGYVTLDDNVLGTLAHALDAILPANIELPIASAAQPTQAQSAEAVIPTESEASTKALLSTEPTTTVIYEPISPAESIPRDDGKWEPPKDKETLFKLFDLHFC